MANLRYGFPSPVSRARCSVASRSPCSLPPGGLPLCLCHAVLTHNLLQCLPPTPGLCRGTVSAAMREYACCGAPQRVKDCELTLLSMPVPLCAPKQDGRRAGAAGADGPPGRPGGPRVLRHALLRALPRPGLRIPARGERSGWRSCMCHLRAWPVTATGRTCMDGKPFFSLQNANFGVFCYRCFAKGTFQGSQTAGFTVLLCCLDTISCLCRIQGLGQGRMHAIAS